MPKLVSWVFLPAFDADLSAHVSMLRAYMHGILIQAAHTTRVDLVKNRRVIITIIEYCRHRLANVVVSLDLIVY